jgi:hypothetical protein
LPCDRFTIGTAFLRIKINFLLLKKFCPFRGKTPSDFSPLFGIPAKNVVKKGCIAPPFKQHFADFSPFCRKIIYIQNIEIIRYEMTFLPFVAHYAMILYRAGRKTQVHLWRGSSSLF